MSNRIARWIEQGLPIGMADLIAVTTEIESLWAHSWACACAWAEENRRLGMAVAARDKAWKEIERLERERDSAREDWKAQTVLTERYLADANRLQVERDELTQKLQSEKDRSRDYKRVRDMWIERAERHADQEYCWAGKAGSYKRERDALLRVVEDLVNAMGAWAAEEDGIYPGAWKAFADAHALLGWALDVEPQDDRAEFGEGEHE